EIPKLVHCALYLHDAAAEQRRTQFAGKHEHLLVHLSNFRPVKRVQDVIEIFDRVRKRVPSRLLMIGDGPERATAEWLAQRKGIRDRELIHGKQDRVQDKRSVADLMRMPRVQEMFRL